MKTVLAAILCVSLMSGGKLFAQEAPPSHDQAAAELLQVLGVERQMQLVINTMTDAMLKNNPVLSPVRGTILEWFQKYFTWEQLGPEFVKLYKEAFTESEMRELLAFYKTPTGQKVLMKMPELMQKGAVIGESIGQAHSGELQDMLKAKLLEIETKKKP